MKKKLLIVNPDQYGYHSDHYYFVKYLKEHFQIDYLCIDHDNPKFNNQGINVIYIKDKNKLSRLLNFILFPIKITKHHHYDVLLANYCKLIYFVGIFSRVPLKILDIRTGALNNNIFKRLYKNLYISFTALFFDKVTVVSGGLAKVLNLSSGKAFIIPVGAEIIDSSPKIYDRLSLIYVGSLHQRNIELTIEGLHLFLQKYHDSIPVHYDIIGFGSPDNKQTIIGNINFYHLDKFVQFHGRKNHSELATYFKNATVGVCFIPQTPYYDIQPATKLFEYALSGLINIATNTMENRNYINLENGIICEDTAQSFSEAIEKVYFSLSKYEEQKIRSSLSDYNWEKITKELLLPILFNKK